MDDGIRSSWRQKPKPNTSDPATVTLTPKPNKASVAGLCKYMKEKCLISVHMSPSGTNEP